MSDLKKKVLRLFEMLESKEVSSNDREFHPTTIQTCRTMHSIELNTLLPEIKALAKEPD